MEGGKNNKMADFVQLSFVLSHSVCELCIIFFFFNNFFNQSSKSTIILGGGQIRDPKPPQLFVNFKINIKLGKIANSYLQLLFSWMEGSDGIEANFCRIPAAPSDSFTFPPAARTS